MLQSPRIVKLEQPTVIDNAASGTLERTSTIGANDNLSAHAPFACVVGPVACNRSGRKLPAATDLNMYRSANLLFEQHR